MNKQHRIEKIQKEIIKVAIIDAPASLMIGVGLYAKFIEGELFLDLLNVPLVVNALLTFGGCITLWVAYKLLTLSREKAELQRRAD